MRVYSAGVKVLHTIYAMLFGFFFSALCIKHQGFYVLKQHFENEEVILQHSQKLVRYFLNKLINVLQ